MGYKITVMIMDGPTLENLIRCIDARRNDGLTVGDDDPLPDDAVEARRLRDAVRALVNGMGDDCYMAVYEEAENRFGEDWVDYVTIEEKLFIFQTVYDDLI